MSAERSDLDGRYRLRVLGPLELLDPAGEPVDDLLSRTKRLALLIYLTANDPGEFTRRDVLLEVFWPDSSLKNARNSLRQSLHVVRDALSPEVLRNRGQEEVAVDREYLACDVVNFRRLREAGRREEALSLYRDDFLQGFHVSNAPRFERWADERRRELRRAAAETAAELAEERSGTDPESALEPARRAVELSGREEPHVRRLMRLLDSLDRREEALVEYARTAERLRDRLGSKPSEEIRQLAEEIQSRGVGPGPELDELPLDPGETSSRPPAAAEEESSWYAGRRGLVAALAALVVLAAGIVVADGAFIGPGGGSDSATDEQLSGLAVLPFEHRRNGGRASDGDDISGLLATAMSGSSTPFPVIGRSVLRSLGSGPDSVSRPSADSLARRFGVRRYVTGTVYHSGDSLRVVARLHRTGETNSESGPVRAAGTRESLFEVVDGLAHGILERLSQKPGRQTVELAAKTTESLSALRAYMTGEHLYRRGQYGEAVGAFRRATNRDSSFALAHYRLSTAANWSGQYRLAREAAERAVLHAARLPSVDRLLVRAWNHQLWGRIGEAKPLYEKVVAGRPGSIEAWYQLGEIEFHWGPQRGQPFTRSRPRFRRVLRYDPDHVPSLYHLTMIASAQRERARMDSMASRVLEQDPSRSVKTVVRAVRAFDGSDSTARSSLLAELRGESASLLELAADAAGVYAQDLKAAASITRLRTGSGHPEYDRLHAWVTLAHLEAARGHPRAARRATEELSNAWHVEHRVLLATGPGGDARPGEIRTLRRVLRQSRGGDTLDGGKLAMAAVALPLYRRPYLLGWLALAQGDLEGARRQASRLEDLVTDPDSTLTPPDVKTSRVRLFRPALLRAAVLARRDSPQAALEMLGPPTLVADRTRPTIRDHYPKIQERWLRARLHERLGNHRRAARWYASFPDPSGYDLGYLPWAHRGRARALAAAGDSARAAEHFRIAAGMWGDGDSTFRRRADAARERADALDPGGDGAAASQTDGQGAASVPDYLQ